MSFQGLISQHLAFWPFLFGFLAVLFYTAKVVKGEKQKALKQAKEYLFPPFILRPPPWWGITKQTESSLIFERLDTFYEWRASFTSSEGPCDDLARFIKAQLSTQDILFDESETRITTGPQIPLSKTYKILEQIRIEGTATEQLERRLYVDLFALRLEKAGQKKIVWMESKSSVLNGGIEGPYFEGVIQNLEWLN